MPFTFLAHQAVVLPLKMWRARWFSGTALVIGSMAPDFEYFIRGRPIGTYGHTTLGQLTFCLPLTLVLTWLVTRIVARPLGAHLPDFPPFHLRDYALAGARSGTASYWLAVVPSALIGSYSHLWWDWFTHDYGAGVKRFPELLRSTLEVAGTPVPGYVVVWHVSTIVGGVVAIALLRRIGRERRVLHWARFTNEEDLPRPTAAESVRFRRLCAVAVAASIMLSVAMAGAVAPAFTAAWWIAIAFRMLVFPVLALALVCALEGWRMQRLGSAPAA